MHLHSFKAIPTISLSLSNYLEKQQQHWHPIYMATENLTIMTLNVNLECRCCYKKLTKILCQIPQVRDRVYDMNKNQVMITVDACCDPEKIRDKLCSKGRKVIKSIII
ncbi:uncharacterized protein LOC131000140 [Salvia miltiorrhiza]|uniref:uncharacterized protein LOC131000140 n=1 Tax=Salvia miltiorrhiza TaxID=226208 RepID=UPI0025AC28EF|nr:uncharacterized protein LOC131000140 [Salvia miltiorrhiza]